MYIKELYTRQCTREGIYHIVAFIPHTGYDKLYSARPLSIRRDQKTYSYAIIMCDFILFRATVLYTLKEGIVALSWRRPQIQYIPTCLFPCYLYWFLLANQRNGQARLCLIYSKQSQKVYRTFVVLNFFVNYSIQCRFIASLISSGGGTQLMLLLLLLDISCDILASARLRYLPDCHAVSLSVILSVSFSHFLSVCQAYPFQVILFSDAANWERQLQSQSGTWDRPPQRK